MNSDNLIRMANQIGGFFETQPDHAEALDGIAEHIRKFWEPRMRRALLEAAQEGSAEGGALKEIVREALAKHRAALTPLPGGERAQSQPTTG